MLPLPDLDEGRTNEEGADLSINPYIAERRTSAT
jgi:hypothetical protein